AACSASQPAQARHAGPGGSSWKHVAGRLATRDDSTVALSVTGIILSPWGGSLSSCAPPPDAGCRVPGRLSTWIAAGLPHPDIPATGTSHDVHARRPGRRPR